MKKVLTLMLMVMPLAACSVGNNLPGEEMGVNAIFNVVSAPMEEVRDIPNEDFTLDFNVSVKMSMSVSYEGESAKADMTGTMKGSLKHLLSDTKALLTITTDMKETENGESTSMSDTTKIYIDGTDGYIDSTTEGRGCVDFEEAGELLMVAYESVLQTGDLTTLLGETEEFDMDALMAIVKGSVEETENSTTYHLYGKQSESAEGVKVKATLKASYTIDSDGRITETNNDLSMEMSMEGMKISMSTNTSLKFNYATPTISFTTFAC